MNNLEPTARELLAELERAHTIIHHALLVMTTEQKQQWTEKNDSAGLIESGTTRFHERRKLIAEAKHTLADAKAASRQTDVDCTACGGTGSQGNGPGYGGCTDCLGTGHAPTPEVCSCCGGAREIVIDRGPEPCPMCTPGRQRAATAPTCWRCTQQETCRANRFCSIERRDLPHGVGGTSK